MDEHLFVEGLALIGLSVRQTRAAEGVEMVSNQRNIEKVLSLMERVAQSENSVREAKYRCYGVEKTDVLALFRENYSWYFEMRYGRLHAKESDFSDIFDNV